MTLKAVWAAVTVLSVTIGLASAQNFGGSPSDGYLRVEWELGRARSGSPVVAGYIHNDRALWVSRVLLLVEELDSAGRPVARVLGYAGGDVPPNARTYFEVPVPRAAATYRVTVASFDWLSGGPSG